MFQYMYELVDVSTVVSNIKFTDMVVLGYVQQCEKLVIGMCISHTPINYDDISAMCLDHSCSRQWTNNFDFHRHGYSRG